MNPIDRLAKIFERFPGIGPRQAERFVQYLLRASPALRRELAENVRELAAAVKQCPDCFRYHSPSSDTNATQKNTCGLCANTARDRTLLAIVASDADLTALENSGTYRGRYFVLGGTIVLGAEKNPHLRMKDLIASLPKRIESGLAEMILAFPANPEGDATAAHLRDELLTHFSAIRMTSLGRGLSTGSELEYADPETLRNALDSRR